MRAEGQSKNTIRRRVGTVRLFERATDRRLLDATVDDIATWLVRFPSPATRSSYFGDLTAYFTWAQRTGHFALVSPLTRMRRPVKPKRRPRPIDTESLMEVRAAAEGDAAVLIDLGAYQALRISEAISVRGEHIVGNTIRVIGKGSNRQGPSDCVIPLHPIIAEHAASRPRRGPWFPSPRLDGRSISGSYGGSLVRDVFAEQGVAATFHMLRHWCATELLRSGADLRYVQEYLRHESMMSTVGYTQVDMASVAAVILRLPQAASSAVAA